MATQASSQSSTSFQGIENPEALGILMDFIRQASGGGSADYRAQRSRRDQAITALQQIMQNYSPDAAFGDAAELMQLNLQQSLEKQMPALSRAVQGAGTSASSMQGLLSNKIAQDSALAAGALGAEQAKAYAGALASLQGTLEEFTRIDSGPAKELLAALDLLRVGRSSSSGSSSGSSGGGGGGGGGGGSGGFHSPIPLGSFGGYQQPTGGSGRFYEGVGDIGNLDQIAADSPFYYDDWGVGSTASGDMAGAGYQSSVDDSINYDEAIPPVETYGVDYWATPDTSDWY